VCGEEVRRREEGRVGLTARGTKSDRAYNYWVSEQKKKKGGLFTISMRRFVFLFSLFLCVVCSLHCTSVCGRHHPHLSIQCYFPVSSHREKTTHALPFPFPFLPSSFGSTTLPYASFLFFKNITQT